MMRAFVFGAAVAFAMPAHAATLGLTTGDPFLTGGSISASGNGAYTMGGAPGGAITVRDTLAGPA